MTNNELREQRETESSIWTDGILQCAAGKPIRGKIKEISDSCKSAVERSGLVPPSNRLGEFYLPFELLDWRALATNVFSGAGAFVGTDLGEVMPALRAASVVMAGGAQVYKNLKGNFSIPREVTPSSFSLYPEVYASGDIASTDLSAGLVSMAPNRASAACSVSRQLDIQTGGRAGQFVLASLAKGAAAIVDQQALVGSGVAGNARGIVNSNTSTVTFSGAATWAKVLSFESQLLTSNIPPDNITFVGHPAVRAKWRNLQRFASTADTLWSDGDMVAGHPALMSTYLSATTGILAGDFSKVALGFWGDGIRVQVNPFINSLQDRVAYIVETHFDCAVLRAEAFVSATDSAVA